MVLSYFGRDKTNDYVLNRYMWHKFGKDKILITTDNGAWALLNDNEFELLRRYEVHKDPNLYNSLKQKGFVVTLDNIKNVVKDYRERFQFLFQGPSLHIIVPTFRCNFKCIYCHSRATPEKFNGPDMDEDTAKKTVDFIMTTPSEEIGIEFQGGEPLEDFDMMKFIIEYAETKAKKKHKKVLFSFTTNLTLMTEEILNFLKEHHIMGLSTSLDGPKEVHDFNRIYENGKGTFDDVVYWIKRIKTEFKQDFNLNALTTITRKSLEYPEEIPKTLFDLGFSSVWLRFMNDLGYAHDKWKKIGYNADEYLNFYYKSMDTIFKLNKKRFFNEAFTTIILKKILNKRDPMMVDIQSPCGAGIGQLLYDYRGDIYTCDEAKILGDTFKLGNVRESTIKDVIDNPKLKAMMNVSSKYPLVCDNCVWSPYCGICPVYSYIRYNNIIPKIPGDFRCKIMKDVIKSTFKGILFDEYKRSVFMKWAKYGVI